MKSAGLSLPLPIRQLLKCKPCQWLSYRSFACFATKVTIYSPFKENLVSLEQPNATLFSTSTMQVPITFENGTNCTFLMLFVPALALHLILGKNNQIATLALVDHYALTITFRHFAINITLPSGKGNAFPSLAPPTMTTSTDFVSYRIFISDPLIDKHFCGDPP